MERKNDFYIRYPYKFHGNYYIHYHAQNIGRLKEGSFEDLSIAFNDSKVQQTANIMKNQYRNLLNNNIHKQVKVTDPSVLELMLQNGSQTNDQLLTQFNQVVQEELQKRVNEKAITTALNTAKSLSLSSSQDTISKNLNNTCQQVNNILITIEKVINKFKKDATAEGIAFTLFDVNTLEGNSNKNKITNMGLNLTSQILQVEEKLQGKLFPFNGTQQKAIIDGMRQLADALIRGTKKGSTKDSPKELTLNSLKHIFDQNIFSTGIGEAIGVKAQKVMNSALKNTLNGLELKGQNNVHFIPSDETGAFKESDSKDDLKMGKVDIKYSNVSLHLGETSFGLGGTLYLDIGISNKLYQSNNFRYNNLTGGGGFEFGGGLTLKQVIDMISSTNKIKYLAYNAFSWSKEPFVKNSEGYINLYHIMGIRSLLNLVSTRGGYQDFAMFMLLNGQLISVWDMLLYVITHKVSYSGEAINIMIKGTKYLSPARELKNGNINTRVSMLNKAFESASITGKIYPGQLYKSGFLQ